MTSIEENISDVAEKDLNRMAIAKYSLLSESLRSSIPENQMCLMFCGGKNCKYENVNKWQNNQAVVGLYSSWITQNILAMSRPNSKLVKDFKIIQQFKSNNINSLINLQMIGEHQHCGPRLESSGFTYQPQEFMDAQISFYNYGWKDYGVGSLKVLIDIVHVMQFAISEGKVAIHCHAGLGRTGVLIACYLVFTNRTNPQVAINYIRSKRPDSIQSNRQIRCINEFYRTILPMRIIFNISQNAPDFPCNLSQFMERQKYFVHGQERKLLKYLPKIIYACCNQIMKLAGVLCMKEDHITKRCNVVFAPSKPNGETRLKITPDYQTIFSFPSQISQIIPSRDIDFAVVTKSVSTESFCTISLLQKPLSNPDLVTSTCDDGLKQKFARERSITKDDIEKAMLRTTYDRKVQESVEELKMELNCSNLGWKRLEEEDNVEVVACLLWSWIDSLKEPILSHQDLPIIIDVTYSFISKILYLEKCSVAIISYILITCLSMQPLSRPFKHRHIISLINFQVIQRIISTLTHQNCVLEYDDITNNIYDDYFMRTSNQSGSMMKTDLSGKLYGFLSDFCTFLSHSDVICDCKRTTDKETI